ncbi:MAG: crosslink repair DNA glycosylase YcaQ family protein [Pseudomonadota bacterium]
MHLTIPNDKARQLILHLQGLFEPPHLHQSREALHAQICNLGYVQVDSIQWVERAHHMILYARNQTYRPKQLKVLLEKDCLLFENWTHDASIIPSAYFRYWRHKFSRDAPVLKTKFVIWQGDGFLGQCDALVERIAKGGPLRSREIEKPSGAKLEMWQWHEGKAALEYLWRTGQLGISGRDGFQKIYDLTHNCLNASCYEAGVSHDEFIDWACSSAIERLGFGSAGDISRFWNLVSIDEVKAWLEGPGAALTTSVLVEPRNGEKPREQVARVDIEDALSVIADPPQRVRALSPFDPVIRNRNRLEWLFGFDYRIEIYVPEVKRKWGYYVFPLLEKDRIIGRIDMRADRKADRLSVKKLWLEPGVKPAAHRLEKISGELVRQARLARVSDVDWDGAIAPYPS